MISFLHAADLHIDSPLRGLARYPDAPAEEFRAATRRAVENLVRLAVEKQVSFVLIAGDVFDGDWKDLNTGDFFRRQMWILHEHGIPVVAIKGNHDAASQISKSLTMPESYTVLSTSQPETLLLENINVAIHGQSFAKRDVTEDLSDRYPHPVRGMFNIGMLHTCAEGTPDHDRYAPCSIAGLRSKEYDYWALGHIHQRTLLCDDPPILFPGNTQGRSVRECGPRGCSIVRVSDGKAETPVHFDLDVVRWRHEPVDVSGCTTLDNVLGEVNSLITGLADEAEGRLTAVRLTLTGDSNAHAALERDPEKVVKELQMVLHTAAAGSLWLEKVCIETRTKVDLDALAESDVALGEIVRLFREMGESGAACIPYAAAFRDFKHRLPRSIQSLGSGHEIDTAEAVQGILEDVKQLLISRLADARVPE